MQKWKSVGLVPFSEVLKVISFNKLTDNFESNNRPSGGIKKLILSITFSLSKPNNTKQIRNAQS